MQINLSDEKDRFSRINHGAFSTDKLTLKTNALANRHWPSLPEDGRTDTQTLALPSAYLVEFTSA